MAQDGPGARGGGQSGESRTLSPSGRAEACPTPRDARSADYREVVGLENRKLIVV